MEKESSTQGESGRPLVTGGPDDIQERTRRATRQLLRWLPWAILNVVVVGASIVVGSVGFVGTAITLTIFSPILVPTSILLFLTVGSGLAVVAVGLAVISACYGLYNYIRGSGAREKPPTKEVPPRTYRQVLAASSA